MSKSIYSTSGSGNWKPQIYFDFESDEKEWKTYIINHYELQRKLSVLIDTSEEIQHIWVYKNPVFPWQRTDLIIYHAFIILKTEMWYWSVEKCSKGIKIQRSEKLQFVRDKYRQKTRPQVTLLRHEDGWMKMEDLVTWLYKENELNLTYYALIRRRNCQGFTDRIFNHFSKRKKRTIQEDITFSDPFEILFPRSRICQVKYGVPLKLPKLLTFSQLTINSDGNCENLRLPLIKSSIH